MDDSLLNVNLSLKSQLKRLQKNMTPDKTPSVLHSKKKHQKIFSSDSDSSIDSSLYSQLKDVSNQDHQTFINKTYNDVSGRFSDDESDFEQEIKKVRNLRKRKRKTSFHVLSESISELDDGPNENYKSNSSLPATELTYADQTYNNNSLDISVDLKDEEDRIKRIKKPKSCRLSGSLNVFGLETDNINFKKKFNEDALNTEHQLNSEGNLMIKNKFKKRKSVQFNLDSIIESLEPPINLKDDDNSVEIPLHVNKSIIQSSRVSDRSGSPASTPTKVTNSYRQADHSKMSLMTTDTSRIRIASPRRSNRVSDRSDSPASTPTKVTNSYRQADHSKMSPMTTDTSRISIASPRRSNRVSDRSDSPASTPTKVTNSYRQADHSKMSLMTTDTSRISIASPRRSNRVSDRSDSPASTPTKVTNSYRQADHSKMSPMTTDTSRISNVFDEDALNTEHQFNSEGNLMIKNKFKKRKSVQFNLDSIIDSLEPPINFKDDDNSVEIPSHVNKLIKSSRVSDRSASPASTPTKVTNSSRQADHSKMSLMTTDTSRISIASPRRSSRVSDRSDSPASTPTKVTNLYSQADHSKMSLMTTDTSRISNASPRRSSRVSDRSDSPASTPTKVSNLSRQADHSKMSLMTTDTSRISIASPRQSSRVSDRSDSPASTPTKVSNSYSQADHSKMSLMTTDTSRISNASPRRSSRVSDRSDSPASTPTKVSNLSRQADHSKMSLMTTDTSRISIASPRQSSRVSDRSDSPASTPTKVTNSYRQADHSKMSLMTTDTSRISNASPRRSSRVSDRSDSPASTPTKVTNSSRLADPNMSPMTSNTSLKSDKAADKSASTGKITINRKSALQPNKISESSNLLLYDSLKLPLPALRPKMHILDEPESHSNDKSSESLDITFPKRNFPTKSFKNKLGSVSFSSKNAVYSSAVIKKLIASSSPAKLIKSSTSQPLIAVSNLYEGFNNSESSISELINSETAKIDLTKLSPHKPFMSVGTTKRNSKELSQIFVVPPPEEFNNSDNIEQNRSNKDISSNELSVNSYASGTEVSVNEKSNSKSFRVSKRKSVNLNFDSILENFKSSAPLPSINDKSQNELNKMGHSRNSLRSNLLNSNEISVNNNSVQLNANRSDQSELLKASPQNSLLKTISPRKQSISDASISTYKDNNNISEPLSKHSINEVSFQSQKSQLLNDKRENVSKNCIIIASSSGANRNANSGTLKQLSIVEFLERLKRPILTKKPFPKNSVDPAVQKKIKTKQKVAGAIMHPIAKKSLDYFSRFKKSKDAHEEMKSITGTFFKQFVGDLSVTAKNRNGVTVRDIYLLMKSFKLVSCEEEMHAKMQELLPIEMWTKVIPTKEVNLGSLSLK